MTVLVLPLRELITSEMWDRSVYSHMMSNPDFFRVQEQGEISVWDGHSCDVCATPIPVITLTVQISVHNPISFIFPLFLFLSFPSSLNFPSFISLPGDTCYFLCPSFSSFLSLVRFDFERKDSSFDIPRFFLFLFFFGSFSLDPLFLSCCFALSVPVPAACYLASALLISIVRSSAVQRYTESAKISVYFFYLVIVIFIYIRFD